VVLTDSHGISRAPCYLGYSSRQEKHFDYGVRTLYDPPFNAVRLYLLVTPTHRQTCLKSPTTPNVQRLPAITHARFSLFRFRSPLLTESRLLSLPVGTEMFHFPTFPLPALYIQAGVTRYARTLAGFPHSDTLGSKLAYQFPEAYRRLLRPSSAPDAKASTVCS
jgi:hypothetical protein